MSYLAGNPQKTGFFMMRLILFQFAIQCDENESHIAVLYCITCETHLCSDCSERSHNTRTLSKHKRVPISEKPKENPKCTFHPMHMVEFTCLEEDCRSNPLMCYICKDYGRHVKHKVSLVYIVRRRITYVYHV